MYNIDTKEEVAVHMCGFDDIRGGNYLGGEPIGRADEMIFTLKQIGEKAREKKRRVYVSFIDLEKAYDMV